MLMQNKIDVGGLPEVTPATEGLLLRGLDLNLAGRAILRQVDLSLGSSGITSLVGPSGAGKSSLLRCINGLQRDWQGEIVVAGREVRRWPGGWERLRAHVGLIAQKPCVFPVSIRANVVFGIHGWRARHQAGTRVEAVLRQAALWDEVKDRLDAPAASLSVGQQQRLCIARALAVAPGLLLLDEPTASLDPTSKRQIEETLRQLAQAMPVLCVSHDLEQVRRLGGQVVFMCDGRVIENAACEAFFDHPRRLESREFLRWKVCDCD